MALNLAAVITRVENFCLDASNVKFTEANITDAVRQALGDISLAAGEVILLDGLDSAAETTLPARLEGVLVTGAAGFLGLMRAGARADWESQSDGEPKRMGEWGSYWLKYFRGRVDDYYPAGTGRMFDQRRTSAPFASWADDFGEKGAAE
jgi:hypothetical protein